jgi:endonuclease YncB( thermonuclease family)
MKFARRVFLLFLFFLLTGTLVLGWDNAKTHPDLSRFAAEWYNDDAELQLSAQQIMWIEQGSINEDADPRYLNHYYNPQSGQGLDDELMMGMSAKEWARKQNSATGDYSESAIFYNYRQGNYRRAYEGIGHIIHLIQDMAVPAHTRNDSHPEGDPFEKWASKNGKIDQDGLRKINITNLDKAFDGLAFYSSKNFYSKDTINFNKIDPDLLIKEEIDKDGNKVFYGYYDKYRIVKIVNYIDGQDYELDYNVHLDYWKMLHPKAIEYSAGVIEYFLKKFEQIDQEKAQAKADGFWERIGNKIIILSEEIKYAWGDVFMVSRLAAGKIWSIYQGNNSDSFNAYEYIKPLIKEGEVLADKIFDQILAEREIDELIKQEPEPEKNSELGIKYVVDGDTVILTNGETVRYIGVNAPDLGQPGSQDDECLAWVARIRNMEFLNAGELKLVKDPAIDRDANGRLLRYVYSAGKMVNEKIALSGLALPDFCQIDKGKCLSGSDMNRINLIKKAFLTAEEKKSGLFSGVCDKTKKEIVEAKQEVSKEQEIPLVNADNGAETPTSTENEKGNDPVASSSPNSVISGGGFVSGNSSSINNFSSDIIINSFNLLDLVTGSIYFTASTTVGANLDISQDVEAYFLSEASSTPAINDEGWREVLCENFVLSSGDGMKNIYLWIKKDDQIKASAKTAIYLDITAPQLDFSSKPFEYSNATSTNFIFSTSEEDIIWRYRLDEETWREIATGTSFSVVDLNEGWHSVTIEASDLAGNLSRLNYHWLVDFTSPTASINNLAESYSVANFLVSWNGNDNFLASSSDIANYDLQYRIDSGEWHDWLSLATGTEAEFHKEISAGSTVFFRIRARDKAENIGEWSGPITTEIKPVSSALSHLVISEVQYEGEDDKGEVVSKDEFVELYNPTKETINLKNFALTRKSQDGSNEYMLLPKSKFPDIDLPPYQYFLIAHPTDYDGDVAPDAVYSSASYGLAANNTVLLYSSTGEIIDKVGYGIAVDCENSPASAPLSREESIERKAIVSSTGESMNNEDLWGGNGYDTDNNLADFVIKSIPQPQNLSGEAEDPAFYNQQLEHQWLFSEEYGSIVYDQVGEDDITLPNSKFQIGDFIELASGETIDRSIAWPSNRSNFSLGFWVNYSNKLTPFIIKLTDLVGQNLVSIRFDEDTCYLGFSDSEKEFECADERWFSFVMAYDSQVKILKIYGNDELIATYFNVIFNSVPGKIFLQNGLELPCEGCVNNSIYNFSLWSDFLTKRRIHEIIYQDIRRYSFLWWIFSC